MRGKLIIIEGSDGSGKATQTNKLFERLTKEGYNTKKIEFPNYKSDSSTLIKMYLNGDFGSNPDDVNPYVASTFYAVDRYASFKTEWKDFYENGGIILADRYTTSNMIHQAAKISDEKQKKAFLDWLWDFEFNLYKLPVPDCVIFLDMHLDCSKRLMETRVNKFTGDEKKDIHESNYEYMLSSYNNSILVADMYKWKKINCSIDNNIKTIDEIHKEVYDIVKIHCHKQP